MKIRTGHVSNSSSSSFCLVIKKEAYKKAYDLLSDMYQDAADLLITDKDWAVVYSGYSTDDNSSLEDIIDWNSELIEKESEKYGKAEYEEALYNLSDELKETLQKNCEGSDWISEETDW